MNTVQKIFKVTLLMTNLMLISYDREREYERDQSQKSTMLWAGIVGAAAGTAIGYWLANLDSHVPKEQYVVEHFEYADSALSSPKAYQVKKELDSLMLYGQYFDLYDTESAVIINLHKLGFQLHQIDKNFYGQLRQNHKILNDAGYSIWWYSLKSLEHQKDLYLSNSHRLIAYFNKHEDFIRTCQIINSYDSLPLYAADLCSWIRSVSRGNKLYPLIAYKDQVQADQNKLVRFERNCSLCYPSLCDHVKVVTKTLDNVIEIICCSAEYQQEIAQKRHDELLAEYNRIEQEKLDVAKHQARALEEANRLTAERNRIERERYQNSREDR